MGKRLAKHFGPGLILAGAAMALLAGCARPPVAASPAQSAFSAPVEAVAEEPPTAQFASAASQVRTPTLWERLWPSGHLAGRTLVADRITDIALQPGEVILTFDDGPRPGKTDLILEILNDFGVHATFLMIGESADQHPELVRAVALAGHTVGSHTYSHANLSLLPNQDAMAEIWAGREAVARALAPLYVQPSRFFRFPYLAQTQVLRTRVLDSNLIVLDVGVDSNDWFRETPEQVLARTLARLDARGQGVILFHDIHARTVTMLPAFLAELEERGYTVVTLRSRGTTVFDSEIIAAVD